MPIPGFLKRSAASVREYFTLASARAEVAAMSTSRVATVSSRLALADQRARAARTLLDGGHGLEAMRLAIGAAESATEAAVAYEAPDGDSAAEHSDAPRTDELVVRALERRGVPHERSVVTAEQLGLAAGLALSLPDLDDGADRARDVLRLTTAAETVTEELAFVRDSSRVLRWTAGARVALVVAALLAMLVALYVLRARRPPLTATASGELHTAFAPPMAVDGNDDTRFLLPDATPGYLDLTVTPPRRVERVVLLNSINAPFNDRATDRYTIEVYSHGRKVRSVSGRLPYAEHPTRVSRNVRADDVERVRIVIHTFHRMGGGMAEVELQ